MTRLSAVRAFRHRYIKRSFASTSNVYQLSTCHSRQSGVVEGTGPLSVLFFGRDEFSCQVLRELRRASDVWKRISVVTQPDEWIGRRHKELSVSPLKLLANDLDFHASCIPSERKDLRTWQPPHPFLKHNSDPDFQSLEHVLVTASFGRILPTSLLRLFHPDRRLNVHPSLLPLYRGPAPIQHALLDGREETGVCVIRMHAAKEGIDVGDIIGRVEIPIPSEIDFIALRRILAVEGGRLLVNVLRDMIQGKARAEPQGDMLDAPHAGFILPSDAFIDFEQMSAEDVVRRHRAISHHRPLVATLHTPTAPGPTLQFIGSSQLPSSDGDSAATLRVHHPELPPNVDLPPNLPGAATYDKHPDSELGTLLVRCARGTVLSVPKLKQQDRKELRAKEWWVGVPREWKEGGRKDGWVRLGRGADSEQDKI